MEYSTFKNEISNLKRYRLSIKTLEADLDQLWYELSGVKGIRYDKEHGSFNPELAEQMRLDLLERISDKERELDYTILAVERYEKRLQALPSDIRELVEQLFINEKTFAEVGKSVGYSDHGLHYRIRKEVEKL